jgi:hypothetical protein
MICVSFTNLVLIKSYSSELKKILCVLKIRFWPCIRLGELPCIKTEVDSFHQIFYRWSSSFLYLTSKYPTMTLFEGGGGISNETLKIKASGRFLKENQ